jgi:ferric-dicitrate binding protein FerR (iron transport regulator)
VLTAALPQAALAQATPLGALRATGEVYVNDARVTGDLTLFVGDRVRTGADGAAGLSIAGRGTLTIARQTQITFASTTRYVGSLQSGTLALRSVPGARNFQIRLGNFTVVPNEEVATSAQIDHAADGSAQVRCLSGSVAVIPLEGEAASFLEPGHAAQISADGKIQTVSPAPAAQPTATEIQRQKRSRAVGIGIAAGAGAAGAALALGRSKGSSAGTPVSPSVP